MTNSRTYHDRYSTDARGERATRDRNKAGGIRRRPILDDTHTTRKGKR